VTGIATVPGPLTTNESVGSSVMVPGVVAAGTRPRGVAVKTPEYPNVTL